MSPASKLLPPTALLLLPLCLCLLAGGARGQVAAETDPSEVSALNSIFRDWRISSSDSNTLSWNTTGDPCSGAAIDANTTLDDFQFNPGIKCNCSFDNGTRCHVTQLKVDGKVGQETAITEDLQNLTQLTMLLLQGNKFSGILPPFIGNMTALQYLNVSGNTLSGSIPRELGKLENLITLDISINRFNGSLPEELGKLNSMEKLCLSSNSLQGQIPSTFADLVNLQTLWIADNNFTGKIPDFIGNIVDLSDLRMYGNSLEGPIPSNYSNLIKLTRLQIGEVVNGSSSLDFLKDMESLNVLMVRNSEISGSFPPDFGNYPSLEYLDLSFNNLTGSIPDDLFNLSSLKYLFLGNNSLSGVLPPQKSNKLLNIDLSYNNLSGNFPSWVNKEPDLNINLVANDFDIDSNSNLSSLRCLQNGFPCREGSLNSRFAVNCGSSQSVGSADVEYEVDDATVEAASYFVSTDNKWAVSSVGMFLDVASPQYIMSTTSRFADTENSELFQNARLSPSSLRYYGIGLLNGNYTVKLSFGETAAWDVQKGRRLFDIFIQGVLVEKDFDITKKAGGITLAAVEWKHTASVTSNFLDVHLFWAGKGTCCIPKYGSYGPSLSAISAITDSDTSGTGTSKKNKTPMIVGIVVAFSVSLLCIVGIFVWRRKRKQDIPKDSEDEDLRDLVIKPNMFSYSDIRNATDNFNPDNELGKGGFGSVYKGTLLDGKEVAVKQLAISSVQGKRQFISEVATVSAVRHRNLVKLHGCCCEGNERLLVYEYMEHRSLEWVLFGPMKLHMNWPSRFRVCLGTARGLAYLHEESSMRIVHRDVKASNILLDASLNPKISDFGLAKIYDEQKSHITTGLAGTVGYLAPEYVMRGQLTEKVDVFSFGVVVLEILCGRRNTEPSLDKDRVYLLEWAWDLHEKKREMEMIDPNLSSYDELEAIRMIGVAFMCTRASPIRRPTMSKVVAILVGDKEVEEIVSKPSYLMQ